MKRSSAPVTVLSLLLVLCSHTAKAQQLVKPLLLKNVRQLPLPDTPRLSLALLTFNDTVENIAVAKLSDEYPAQYTVIATAAMGKGRIIALGSSAYLQQDLLGDSNVHQLAQNILTWAGNGHKRPKMGLYTAADSAFLSLIHQQHISTYAIKNAGIEKYTDIVYLETDINGKDSLDALEAFVRNGGTLIQVSPAEALLRKSLVKPGNAKPLGINTLLGKAGIADIYIAFYSTATNNTLITDSVPDYLHFSTMRTWLKHPATGDMGDIINMYIVQPMIELLFKYNDLHAGALQELKARYHVPDTLAIPTPQHPVTLFSPEDKFRYHLAQCFQEKKYAAANKHAISPAAHYFPGAVPDTAARITTSITIPVQVGAQGLLEPTAVYFRPHSTGLYVPPGEVVKVVLQTKDTGQHLKAQIGVHSDDLADLDRLTRSAENMVRTFPLEKDTTEIYSPFGGLLQLNIGDTSTLKAIQLTVIGAVKAPYFKLGETNETDWIAGIRNNPAPWAELATDKIILTVPAYRIRKLNDPVKLMQFYDEVMDADADLAKIPRKRVHPERVIVDQEVAYGYMFTIPEHIIVPDDQSCEWMLNETYIREHGSWGLFHELGHRHQFWGIDFGELQEVTVNLFTMYVYDKVLHKGIYNHDDIGSKEKVLSNINNYLHHEPSFEKWSQDPFLALSMYIELIQQFGWQCIDDMYTKYRNTPEQQFPQSAQDKRDYWFQTICEVTKTNLTQFFDIWKVPVSAQAKEKVKAYPVWLPAELKAYDTPKTAALSRL